MCKTPKSEGVACMMHMSMHQRPLILCLLKNISIFDDSNAIFYSIFLKSATNFLPNISRAYHDFKYSDEVIGTLKS